MSFYLKLFLKLFRVNLKAQMEYRTNFVLSIIHISFLQMGSVALIWVILNKFHTLKGWGFGEVAFLVGLRLLSHGIFVLFMSEVWRLGEHIIRGEFDRFLLKPINPLFNMIANSMEIRGLTDFSSGVLIFGIASIYLRLHWTSTKLLFLAAVILGAILIQFAVYLAVSSVSFWILKFDEALNYITFQLHEQYILYPVSIYGRPIQYFLTFIIPFAFINFYPSAYFLDKTSVILFHPYFVYLTPLVGFVSFCAAYLIWKRGILVYQSTGS